MSAAQTLCPSCQTPIAEGHKFCAGCGQPVSVACPGCSSTISVGFKFCPGCGAPVKGAGGARPAPSRAKGGTGPLPPRRGTGELVGQVGDRRVVTVLFTDVSGFTSMSEKLDPEEVTDVINAFFKVLTEPIYQLGGVVDKYIGDAIMALFGAPVAHEDDPARAVMAAWEMQKAAKRFADKLEARTGIRLRVRIGLNTGLVVAGSVGGDQRQDYTVMGDTVNLAQRMESSAPVGGILVTHETYRQCRHLFEFQAHDPVPVKGKAEPVQTYEVLRPLPQRHLAARAQAPLVGRAAEAERLAAVLAAAWAGKPQLAEVVGEAGTGKTRLIREVCGTAGLEPVVAGCQSFQRHVPYALLARLLEAWLDLPIERTPETTNERMHAAFDGLPEFPEPERAQVFLAHLLHHEIETPELAALSPQQRRSAAFKAMSDLLVAIARKGREPLVLVLDDLQWADEASLQWLPEFLTHLVGLAEGSLVDAQDGAVAVPLAIVAAYRADDLAHLIPDISDLPRLRLPLERLADADSAMLLGNLLAAGEADRALPPELQALGRSVLSRAEGNPYFLEELVAGLIDTGVLVRSESGTWSVTQKGTVTLPPTVNGVVASRLDRLSPPLRSALQVASVLGRTFSVEMLSRVRPADSYPDLLEDLARGGFVMGAGPGEYSFAQQIVQEVAYSSMLLASRKDLHMRAAEALEEANLVAPDTLARHWGLAGNRAKAALYLWMSGDQARANFANAEATDAYIQALANLDALRDADPPVPDPVPRSIVLRCLAEVETVAGDPEEALRHLDQARALAGDGAERARIFQARGAAQERLGQFPTALAEYQTALGQLAGEPSATELAARIRIDTAFLHYRLGDQHQCIRLCTEALDLLKEVSALRDKALAHSILGLCLFQQSRYAEAAEHHRYALRLREDAQDFYGVAASRNNLGLIGSHTAAWSESVSHFMAALEGFARVGDLGKVSLVEGNLGMLLCRQGDLARAESHLRHALEIHIRHKNQFGIGSTEAMLGLVKIEAQQADQALPLLSAALEGFEATGAAEQQAEIHQLLGRAHLDRGAAEAAAPALARALELAAQSGEKVQEGVARRLLARLARQRGDLASAEREIAAALLVLEPTGNQHELGRALLDAADIHAASGRHAEAAAAQRKARELFETLGAKLDLARCEVPA
ncbi:MAG: tetratricopeptide repeat protein [Candidatus Sericytochromatia bacterium]|nr:tetratricopeptide repeat protein [Candidatus Tanganyikabacteria bacterium]